MTANKKIDLLLRMQIHCMNPNGSGESTASLLQEAAEALEETATIDAADTSLDIVEDLLIDIGVPHHIVGYRAMVEAILMVMKNHDVLRAITKELYPAVAAKCGSTPSRVERSIRHAIEICFDRSDWETLTKYFGRTVNPASGRPTVSEFVSMMADTAIRVERKIQKGE